MHFRSKIGNFLTFIAIFNLDTLNLNLIIIIVHQKEREKKQIVKPFLIG